MFSRTSRSCTGSPPRISSSKSTSAAVWIFSSLFTLFQMSSDTLERIIWNAVTWSVLIHWSCLRTVFFILSVQRASFIVHSSSVSPSGRCGVAARYAVKASAHASSVVSSARVGAVEAKVVMVFTQEASLIPCLTGTLMLLGT